MAEIKALKARKTSLTKKLQIVKGILLSSTGNHGENVIGHNED